MQEGIYEQIINEKIRNQLNYLSQDDYLIDTENLDVEEAKVFLSSYISEVIQVALAIIREEEKVTDRAILEQIRLCNEIIDILSERLQDDEFHELKLDERGEILTSLYSKLNNVYALSHK